MMGKAGAAALAAMQNYTFSILLTGHAMPHMTGAQLAREVIRWRALVI